jgi:hypothetical protein
VAIGLTGEAGVLGVEGGEAGGVIATCYDVNHGDRKARDFTIGMAADEHG